MAPPNYLVLKGQVLKPALTEGYADSGYPVRSGY